MTAILNKQNKSGSTPVSALGRNGARPPDNRLHCASRVSIGQTSTPVTASKLESGCNFRQTRLKTTLLGKSRVTVIWSSEDGATNLSIELDDTTALALGTDPATENWTLFAAEGRVDSESKRRGRVTEDFKVAAFFDHVKANEGGY